MLPSLTRLTLSDVGVNLSSSRLSHSTTVRVYDYQVGQEAQPQSPVSPVSDGSETPSESGSGDVLDYKSGGDTPYESPGSIERAYKYSRKEREDERQAKMPRVRDEYMPLSQTNKEEDSKDAESDDSEEMIVVASPIEPEEPGSHEDSKDAESDDSEEMIVVASPIEPEEPGSHGHASDRVEKVAEVAQPGNTYPRSNGAECPSSEQAPVAFTWPPYEPEEQSDGFNSSVTAMEARRNKLLTEVICKLNKRKEKASKHLTVMEEKKTADEIVSHGRDILQCVIELLDFLEDALEKSALAAYSFRIDSSGAYVRLEMLRIAKSLNETLTSLGDYAMKARNDAGNRQAEDKAGTTRDVRDMAFDLRRLVNEQQKRRLRFINANQNDKNYFATSVSIDRKQARAGLGRIIEYLEEKTDSVGRKEANQLYKRYL